MSDELGYNEIDFAAYQEQFADNDAANYVLIDVREVDEYADGRIPGAINLPLSEMEERFSEVPQDKEVVLVCARGGRSGRAAEFLTTQDYDGDKLYNLLGGTMGWIAEGNPTEK